MRSPRRWRPSPRSAPPHEPTGPGCLAAGGPGSTRRSSGSSAFGRSWTAASAAAASASRPVRSTTPTTRSRPADRVRCSWNRGPEPPGTPRTTLVAMALRMVATKPDPALVTLPWQLSLDDWGDDVVVPLPRGLSRHIVRIVRLGQDVYAVKQTREHMAYREYRLLRDLRRIGLPTVEPVGVVTGREDQNGEEIEPALMTKHLQYSLPYRSLFSHGVPQESLPKILDALVVLLVRLHLAGFFWGDVSLSNVLFRRSAGEFSAYLVDAETGEL